MLILFLLYRALYSEWDDARYYCFQGIWEDQISARVTGKVEQLRLHAGGEEQSSTGIYLRNCSITLSGDRRSYSLNRLLVYWEGAPALEPGNCLELSGALAEFSRSTNPGQFDQRDYYKEKGIYYQLFAVDGAVVSPRVNQLQSILYHFRDRMEEVYVTCLPRREGGIVSAMLLGDKSLLDMDIRQLYQESGIGHLLAISGLHVAILGMAVYRLLKRLLLTDHIAVPAGILAVLAYGRMTDFSISTSRAVIMLILFLTAQWVGRTYDGKNALAFAAVVILLQHPFALFSCSFLLSFGAMAGIYVILPVLKTVWLGDAAMQRERRRKRHRWEKEIKENAPLGRVWIFLRRLLDRAGSMLLMSVSVQLATLPVVLYFYFEAPVYGVVINLAVLPLASFVVLLSFLGGILGCVYPPAGQWLLGSVYYLLKFYEKLCHLFQRLPGAVQILGKPEGWQIAVYYLLLLFLLLFLWRLDRYLEEAAAYGAQGGRDRLRSVLSGSGRLGPLLCVLFLFPLPVQGFSMTMLDVGQGDSIFIRTAEKQTILVDGGSTSEGQVGRYRILPFLKAEGIRRLDYMLLTHSDEDHSNGLTEVLEASGTGGFSVDTLVLPAVADPEGYVSLCTLAAEKGIRICRLSEGYVLRSGELSLTCLNPVKNFQSASANDESITLSLLYRGFSCLLTGDLAGEGEEHVKALLQSPVSRRKYQLPEHYTVLKVAHHGSKNSTDEEFLQLVRPELALISCGRKNRYGHPHGELLDRLKAAGAVALRTDQEGAAEGELRDGILRFTGFLSRNRGADFEALCKN